MGLRCFCSFAFSWFANDLRPGKRGGEETRAGGVVNRAYCCLVKLHWIPLARKCLSTVYHSSIYVCVYSFDFFLYLPVRPHWVKDCQRDYSNYCNLTFAETRGDTCSICLLYTACLTHTVFRRFKELFLPFAPLSPSCKRSSDIPQVRPLWNAADFETYTLNNKGRIRTFYSRFVNVLSIVLRCFVALKMPGFWVVIFSLLSLSSAHYFLSDVASQVATWL